MDDVKVSNMLESFMKDMEPGADVTFLQETLPQIRRLEARVERAERRYRNLRLFANSMTKTIKQIRLITGSNFINPYEPERYDGDVDFDDD